MVNDSAFHEPLLAVVDEYLQYAMVDTTPMLAPELCSAPDQTDLAPKITQSDDEETHGKKLYFLFVNDIAHYLNQDGSKTPIGQAIVKESWSSIESNPDAHNLRSHASGNRVNPRVKDGDKILEIERRKDLFVMLKLAEETPGTDQGWIYGLVTPDTKEVTAAGKIATCAQCHESAKHDRLFGPTTFAP